MGGFADIHGVLYTLRTATQIAKSILSADTAIEKAELKLKIADLMTQLAEAQTDVIEIDQQQDEMRKHIAELEKALENKSKVTLNGDAYYEIDENHNPTGNPYCLRCWEVDHKLVHLAFMQGTKYCPSCKRTYDIHRTKAM